MLYQGHTCQTRHQHVFLQGAQVDEWAQLPGQVAVMGEGHLLGGVCREGHGQVTATEYQLKQVVPPGGKRRLTQLQHSIQEEGGRGCPPQTKILLLKTLDKHMGKHGHKATIHILEKSSSTLSFIRAVTKRIVWRH